MTIQKIGKAVLTIANTSTQKVWLDRGEELVLKGTAGQTVTVTDTFDIKEIPTSKDIIGGFQLFGSDGTSIVTAKANNTAATNADISLEVKIASAGGVLVTATGVPVLLQGANIALGVTQSTTPWTVTGNRTEGAAPTVGANQQILVSKDGSGNLQFVPLVAGTDFVSDLPAIIDLDGSNAAALINGGLFVKQQGTVAGSLGTATLNSFAGNATLSPGAALLYSAMFTGTGAANKVLTLGGNQVSSKTAASSPADLLDRIIAVPSATALGLANGVAGDTIRVTYVLLP